MKEMTSTGYTACVRYQYRLPGTSLHVRSTQQQGTDAEPNRACQLTVFTKGRSHGRDPAGASRVDVQDFVSRPSGHDPGPPTRNTRRARGSPSFHARLACCCLPYGPGPAVCSQLPHGHNSGGDRHGVVAEIWCDGSPGTKKRPCLPFRQSSFAPSLGAIWEEAVAASQLTMSDCRFKDDRCPITAEEDVAIGVATSCRI